MRAPSRTADEHMRHAVSGLASRQPVGSLRWLRRGATRPLCIEGTRQRLEINTSHPGVSRLHSEPPIFVVEDFLPLSMCERICAAARPLLKPSTVVHMAEDERSQAGIRSGGGRDSSSTYLHHRSVPALLTRAEGDHTVRPQGSMRPPAFRPLTPPARASARRRSIARSGTFCRRSTTRASTLIAQRKRVRSSCACSSVSRSLL